jgi:fermentation-respiration switch protein FrsA (DUF1100 family)
VSFFFVRSRAGPLLILHTEDDQVIPCSQSKENFESSVSKYKILKQFQLGGHNHLRSCNGDEYWKLIGDFLEHSIG